jgi:23S rRNA (guanosine2251-2'-O)-methyltransferase
LNKKSTTTKITELLYGIHPVLELLKAKRRKLAMIYTTKPIPKGLQVIEPLLPKTVQIQYVTREVLTKLAGTIDHQGVVAYATPFVVRKKFFEPERQKSLVLLDGIQDVRNLGAILRSAYCTGVDGVILVKKQGAPLNAAALKASAGLAEYLEIYLAPSATYAVQELKKAGYNLYLAVVQNGVDATEIEYKQPHCLIIGSEALGISPELRQAGQLITLPQRHPDISYNASVAAGILLFLISQKKA